MFCLLCKKKGNYPFNMRFKTSGVNKLKSRPTNFFTDKWS